MSDAEVLRKEVDVDCMVISVGRRERHNLPWLFIFGSR